MTDSPVPFGKGLRHTATSHGVSKSQVSRREWLSTVALAGGTLLSGFGLFGCHSSQLPIDEDAFAGGKLIGNLPFVNEGDIELDTPLRSELDGRLYSDLSTLTPDNLVTPTEKFYIRTRASELLDYQKSWSIRVTGFGRASTLALDEIKSKSRSLGLHLMECAGNSRLGHFGLISVADWVGVPVLSVIDQNLFATRSTKIRISGFDIYKATSATSEPGASWIFSLEDLNKAGAFFATEMNGEPLTPDHGAPIRLVVPGWYGCSCIKWVNEVTMVAGNALATPQMQEYASRTHQNGVPVLADEYEPAIIDPAAMPIRVEKWIVGGHIGYRIVGVAWGGSEPPMSLNIQIGQQHPVEVEKIYAASLSPWSMWTHSWTPRETGRSAIRLMIANPKVRTRRLNSGFYTRTVEIQEV